MQFLGTLLVKFCLREFLHVQCCGFRTKNHPVRVNQKRLVLDLCKKLERHAESIFITTQTVDLKVEQIMKTSSSSAVGNLDYLNHFCTTNRV